MQRQQIKLPRTKAMSRHKFFRILISSFSLNNQRKRDRAPNYPSKILIGQAFFEISKSESTATRAISI
jgi:hypothetical protein